VQHSHSARVRDGRAPDSTTRPTGLAKAPTGIAGLDVVTRGGLPRGRTTLVSGSAGSGKTLFALEFLVRGAMTYDEPGLFVSFEETADELSANVASIGFDLPTLVARGSLRIDDVRLDPSEFELAGAFDLDGLFIRLAHAIDAIGATRVVLDTLEVLFGGLAESAIVRQELGRLFRWLKDRGVTAVVTAERHEGGLTRHGLEEFVSDCVIVLDHRVAEEQSVRRLRIVKYRGSDHGADEYPFLIDADGIRVVPLSAAGLEYDVSSELVSTGIPDLDAMLGGGGVYRGSSVLLSGTAGTGKTSIAASFADAACRRGERCIFFSFEESAGQIIRNLASIGLDLRRWVDADLLRFHCARPTTFGLENHLARMHRVIDAFDPALVIADPITTFDAITDERGVGAMITRLMDLCRTRGITSVFTSLSAGGEPLEATSANVSSVADAWLLLRDIESDAERNRALYVLKARGLAHSNQVREFRLDSDGIALVPVIVGVDGIKTGAARAAHEARERLAALARRQEIERAQLEFELHRARHAAAQAALDAELAAEEARARMLIDQVDAGDTLRSREHRAQSLRRGARNDGDG
jgi:circadian clock protein KaiC